MKKIILLASVVIASGLLLTNVYTSLVDARSWGSNIPLSISVAREYYKVSNPGDFFRIFSPLNQLISLVVLVLFWKSSASIRMLLCSAFVLYVAIDAFTFLYFYPRNEIMFGNGSLANTDTLHSAWSQWRHMNWLRSLMGFTGVCLSLSAMDKLYTQEKL